MLIQIQRSPVQSSDHLAPFFPLWGFFCVCVCVWGARKKNINAESIKFYTVQHGIEFHIKIPEMKQNKSSSSSFPHMF